MLSAGIRKADVSPTTEVDAMPLENPYARREVYGDLRDGRLFTNSHWAVS